jgi:hypothetical protein
LLCTFRYFDLKKANISLFKVRGSWGRTGNDTEPYRVFNILQNTDISFGGNGKVLFPFEGVAGSTIANQLNKCKVKT